MKTLILSAVLALMAVPCVAASQDAQVQVKVWGRDWIVAPIDDHPGMYRAIRLNLEHNPYRGPARTRTSQAIRAFNTATGCKPDIKSMYQVITGEFHARLICPSQ
ncbi:MAG: hypothetical protein ACU0BB_17500 [Paracoccaceae bacterium]|jgi:hypothetical protein